MCLLVGRVGFAAASLLQVITTTMISNEEYIEEVIEKTEKDIYNGNMPANNKNSLRNLLKKELAFWERYEGREEIGHSHSAVGDAFNMGGNQE